MRSSVVLRDPASGHIVALLAGQECPDWAEPLITNPDALAEPKPEPAKPRTTRAKAK